MVYALLYFGGLEVAQRDGYTGDKTAIYGHKVNANTCSLSLTPTDKVPNPPQMHVFRSGSRLGNPEEPP